MVWVILLTVLHTAAAYDVVNPFSWKAVEDAERHATAAVASLYADTVRMQQRVKEQVFAPQVADSVPAQECPPSPDPVVCQTAAGSGRALLFTLVAITAAFLVGWSCGTKQAQSQQAMQQAKAADKQAQACLNPPSETAAANLASTPENLSAVPLQQPTEALMHVPDSSLSTQPQCEAQMLPPLAEARKLGITDDESEQGSVNVLDQSHQASQSNAMRDAAMTSRTVMIHALHSVVLTVLHDDVHLGACLFCVQASAEIEEDCTSSWGSVSDADDQLTSEQQLHEQHRHHHHHQQQQGQNRQDSAPAPRHVMADIADQQASSSHQSSNEHLQQMHQPSQQTRPNEQTAAAQSHHAVVSASLLANGPRRVLGSSSHNTQLKDLQQQDDSLALADDASYLIDALIQRQGLNPQQLDVNVKLGLIVQAIGLLNTHRHQQENHRCSPCQILHANNRLCTVSRAC